MYILSSKITIGNWVFNQIIDVEINSSYENLSDTCTITIPRKLSFQGKTIALGQNAIFKKGDAVNIQLGYGYDNKQTVFVGYVLRVESGLPTKIICTDSSYLLKQTQPFNLTYKALNIQSLLSDISPIPYYAPDDILLGKCSFNKQTAAQILHQLRNKFGIRSWCRNGTLYCGLNYFPQIQKTYQFQFYKNIISDNLQYQIADDTVIGVEAISHLPNDTKLIVKVGDQDGATRTFHYYNVTDTNDLTKRATEQLNNLKFDGFTGSFTTFGLFNVLHGDIVQLTDNYFPEKNGKYIVKSVQTKFGVGVGYRQEIELAQKIS